MRTRLVRFGRGFALPIEQSLFDELGIGESTPLEITVDGKVIVVRALDDAEDREARFQAALDDVNRRFGNAMRRLADS